MEGFAALPNGDGSTGVYPDYHGAGLKGVVSDWINGGALKGHVVATYGPIQEWNTSQVTNMDSIFSNMGLTREIS